MRELILYAVPLGTLGAQISECFEGIATEAQRYPPHCTLTGFFHDDDVARYVEALAEVAGPARVSVLQLRTVGSDWIGLELESPDLLALSMRFAGSVADAGTRQDDIRLKDWLHVSLAHGHDPACHWELTKRAKQCVNPVAASNWELRLYERRDDGEWAVHGSWSLDQPETGAPLVD